MTQLLLDGFRAFDIGFFFRNPSRCTHPTMATAVATAMNCIGNGQRRAGWV
ncbi:hypothetical protein [Achromobacter spanius]|uniref:hypothetical protein n=1 Tax=Achromobacter spanius TaxID=217203 RepID=UPI003F6910F5